MNGRRADWASRALVAGAGALYVAAAAGLLYAAFCQWTWSKLQLHDYGIYTNFLWNTARGDFFRVLVDGTYLATHLSFTLVLIAPLFLVWDHPLLLTVVQWACGIGGSVLVGAIARRFGLSSMLTASLMLLFLGHAYAQSTLTCEFHGVSLYLVLLPWFFYTLSFARRWAWLPFALLLGLREDAAFVIITFPLFFAIRDRWKAGYVYAAIALIYGIVAVEVLFPTLTGGLRVEERRAALVNAHSMLKSFGSGENRARAAALFWLFLPAIAAWRRRGWVPAVVLPLAALLILMMSPLDHHHGLERHYAAAPFTSMALGLMAGLSRRNPAPTGRGLPALLIAIVLASHLAFGALPTGGATHEHLGAIDANGLEAFRAARLIPRDGVLLCDYRLAGFCANRPDLITLKHLEPQHDVDLYFLMAGHFFTDPTGLPARVRRGELGVRFFDERYIVLQRGFSAAAQASVFDPPRDETRTIEFAYTRFREGDNVYAPGCGAARHWRGGRKEPTAKLSYEQSVRLPAGPCRAWFRLRAEAPEQGAQAHWGLLRIYAAGQPGPLVEQRIDALATGPEDFRWQEVRFDLPENARVEAQVWGAAAPLWLDRVIFVPESAMEIRSLPGAGA